MRPVFCGGARHRAPLQNIVRASLPMLLRKLFIWLVLGLMPFNGLWVVCSVASFETPLPATGLPAQSEESAECRKMCALKQQAHEGTICVVLPGDAKTSITVLNFGVAVLPSEVQLQPTAAAEEFVAELPGFYSNPSLSEHAPPPRT